MTSESEIRGHGKRHRFWSLVRREGECAIWTSGMYPDGYGRFYFDGRDHRAHRVALFRRYGRWPEPCCLHRCDVRACVRPSHLFEGTRADNMADMIAKGRARHPPMMGEQIGTSKLEASDIPAIRLALAGGETLQSIADRYGVTFSNISCIKRGITWRHVS